MVFFALSLLLLIQLGSIETRFILSREEKQANISKSHALIHELCNSAASEFYNECVSTIESDPRKDLKTTPKGFIRILNERALANATTTRTLVANLLQKATDNVTIDCLNLCYGNYLVGIDCLNNSLGIIDDFTKDYNTYENLNMLVGDFLIEVDECEDAWSEEPARKSPLTAISKYFDALSVSSMGIMNIVYCNLTDFCMYGMT